MDTRLNQYSSTSGMSYKDYLKKQAQDELDALSKQQQGTSNAVSSGSSAVDQAQQQLAQINNTPTVLPTGLQTDLSQLAQQIAGSGGSGNAGYSLAGGQGSILSQAGPITENFGQSQPGVEVFSHGFTNGTGIGVPTGTKVALPPGKWGVVDSYANDNREGHIGDGTNSGYGNSVLVQNLQTGEKLRFSHLSKNGAQPGSVLPGGTVFGETGATGNVTGPHLNLEYYQPNGQLGDVLRSPYANYLGASGSKGNGKGGGNPIMDAMGRLANGVKQTGQDFASGYLSGPQDPSSSETSVKGFGNFLANGTPAGEGGALVGHTLGAIAPHLGQAAHGLTALPLMAGAITKYNKQMPQAEIDDFAPALQRYFDQNQNINYALSPHASNDENLLRSYAADYINREFGNKAPLQTVAQELWNRALVDRQQISPAKK